jgi:GNAT superfamily N-acetyltransferase
VRSEDEINIANLYSLYQCVADNTHATQIFSYDGYKIIKTDDSVWPNTVYDINTISFTDDFVKSIKAGMTERGAGPVLFEPCEERVALYKQNGILPADRWVGMVKNKLDAVERRVNEAEVRSIDDSEIAEWVKIVSDVLFGGKQLLTTIFTSLPKENNGYIALWIDGEMVGTSMIHYDVAGNAGIYMVCVSENHRGKGLGRALIEYCYECVKKRGMNSCVLQATQKGIPLYTSMGFESFGNYTLLMKLR